MLAVHPTRWLLPLMLAVVVFAPAAAAEVVQNGRVLGLNAEIVLLLDPEGKVLYQKNADVDHAPASLVKLMTLYLAFEDIEHGRARPDDLVTVSRHATSAGRYRIGLRAGDRIPLRVLLDAVGIASANDAATAVAEHLGGDEPMFVSRMNAKARELGLTGTRYANPHGLPDPLQRTNAWDLARLTARLLQDHPAARGVLGGQSFTMNGRLHTRRIPLFKNPGGVEALKTGFTNEAGYNLAVSAARENHEFLMIVMGARSRALSFLDAKKLLQYGFVETGLQVPEPVRARPAKKILRARRIKARSGPAPRQREAREHHPRRVRSAR